MRTGDTVRDGQGNAYQVGQLLGRGLWGKSFVARRESNDALYVLKCPLGPDDVRGETPAPEGFFAACREALMEQARLYEQGQLPFLPRLEARFTAPDGQPAMLLPRFGESLERRILEGMPVGAAIDALSGVVKQVRQLAASSATGAPFHGGLKPSNVFFTDRGEIFLTDVATPAVRRHITLFAGMFAEGVPWLPPELTAGAEPAWTAGGDTWALAAAIWRAVQGPGMPSAWPRRGLDKAAAQAVKDKLIERMKAEDSNPRFHLRLAERVGVLLSRALSPETTPSPPFRFARLDEFGQRLEEVSALIRPQITSVGKVLHTRPASKPWFDTDEAVDFSVTVGASAGVEGQEEIGVGIAVFDLVREERLKQLDLGYTVDKHPSGRYRFAFRISGVSPGHYRIRAAFAIRDSGQQPAVAETEVEVRAAPGWVPPPEDPVAQALPFAREVTGVTRPEGLPAPAATATPGATPLTSAPLASPPSAPPAQGAAPPPSPAASAPVRSVPAGAPLPGGNPVAVHPASIVPAPPATPALVGPPGPARPAAPVSAPTITTVRAPDPGATSDLDPPSRRGFVARPPAEPEPTPTHGPLPIPPDGMSAPGVPPVPLAIAPHIPVGSLAPSTTPVAASPAAHAPRATPGGAPIASPVPPPPAASVVGDEPRFEAPKNWTYEPIPRARGATDPSGGQHADRRSLTAGEQGGAGGAYDESAGTHDGSEQDPALADGPGLLERIVQALRNDPYVLVMSCLGAVITFLFLVFLAIRS